MTDDYSKYVWWESKDKLTAHLINPALAKQMGISDECLAILKDLSRKRYKIEGRMAKLSPEKNRRALANRYAEWVENEYELQNAWGFDKNANYFREYLIPHCTCPEMDNEDRWPHGMIVNEDCIYHGGGK